MMGWNLLSLLPGKIFSLIVLVRLLSVFLVQTWFVPDEYWQSLEVAHNLAFGYGHLTWEWKNAVRSYVHPGIIAGVYKLLDLAGLDRVEVLIYLPRVLQALLSAVADYSFYKWSNNHKWSLFLTLMSWSWFYTASRTLINTVETCLLVIGLSTFPFKDRRIFKEDNRWISLAVISVLVRPTSLIIWTPFVFYHLKNTNQDKKRLLLLRYLPAILAFGGLSVAIDSYFYGRVVISQWEFFRINVLEGISGSYGSHPWYWYIAIGLPTILGINLLPLIPATIETAKTKYLYHTQKVLLSAVLFTLVVYSVIPHKEFRFILPLLPLCLFVCQDAIARWSRKAKSLHVYLAAAIIVLGNLAPIGYFSLIHQRGNLDVIGVVRDLAIQHPTNTSVLFLMPCHSTPLYSHIHVNIETRFLSCEPNLSKEPNFKEEAVAFYEEPATWIQRQYLDPKVPLPSHVVIFDVLESRIRNLLVNYNKLHSLYNTEWPCDDRIGTNILVYERVGRHAGAKRPGAKQDKPS